MNTLLLSSLVMAGGMVTAPQLAEEKEFTLVVLQSGIQGAESKAMRINPAGQVAGFFRVDPNKAKGKRRAYGADLFGEKDKDRIQEVPNDYVYSDAYCINKDNVICGSGDKTNDNTRPVAVVWKPKDKDYEKVDLGALFGGKISTAYGINDLGFVVGGFYKFNNELKLDVVRGFYHELGKNNFEEMLASRFKTGFGNKEIPYTHVIAAAVNNQGHVVGSEFMSFFGASGQDRFGQRSVGFVDSNAFIWSTGRGNLVQVTPLKDTNGKFRTEANGRDSYGYDVNEHKLVVGGETVTKNPLVIQAVVWNSKTLDNKGPAVALSKVAGRNNAVAMGVNTLPDPQKSVVVGKAFDFMAGKQTKEIAVRWKRKKDDEFEKGEDLNELTDFGPYGKKFVLAEARSVSPNGEIVGWGYEFEDDDKTKLKGIFSFKLKKKKPMEKKIP